MLHQSRAPRHLRVPHGLPSYRRPATPQLLRFALNRRKPRRTRLSSRSPRYLHARHSARPLVRVGPWRTSGEAPPVSRTRRPSRRRRRATPPSASSPICGRATSRQADRYRRPPLPRPRSKIRQEPNRQVARPLPSESRLACWTHFSSGKTERANSRRAMQSLRGGVQVAARKGWHRSPSQHCSCAATVPPRRLGCWRSAQCPAAQAAEIAST
jgi:hypothetical protein